MNPRTAPTSRRDGHRAPERMRNLEDLTAQARDNLVDRVRAARKRLAKTPPRVARLR